MRIKVGWDAKRDQIRIGLLRVAPPIVKNSFVPLTVFITAALRSSLSHSLRPLVAWLERPEQGNKKRCGQPNQDVEWQPDAQVITDAIAAGAKNQEVGLIANGTGVAR